MILCGLVILMCVCNYEEDEKNQKILVGYSSLAAETSVLTPIPRNTCVLPVHTCPAHNLHTGDEIHLYI